MTTGGFFFACRIGIFYGLALIHRARIVCPVNALGRRVPDLILSNGQSVIIDDEDYEWASSIRWYIRDRKDRGRTIINDEVIGCRKFRIFLHRAIALRMHPELEHALRTLVVKAKNGDYTDVRRSNLEIIIRKKRGAAYRKPEGWSVKSNRKDRDAIRSELIDIRDIKRGHSPLWSGGLTSRKTQRLSLDGKRREFWFFDGRLVVDENGPCGGGFRADNGGRFAYTSGRSSKRSAEIYVCGEDEGGGVCEGLGDSSEETGDS